MRNLDECKAEIFRRSEERIKKRRQNITRTLAVCLPLCVVAAVCVNLMLLPSVEENSNGTADSSVCASDIDENNSHSSNVTEDDLNGENVCTESSLCTKEQYSSDENAESGSVYYITAQITGMGASEGYRLSITEADEAQRLFDMIDALLENADSIDENSQGNSAGKMYLITFTSSDGYSASYILDGSILRTACDDSTGVSLGKQQLTELKQELRIYE